MKQRHVRPGDDLRGDEVVVIRGGELDAAVLRSDALRCHSIYGTYGISVFAARDVTVDELAQQPPLVRFELLTLVETGVLRVAGFRLEPTGRNPRHFTVAFDDLAFTVAFDDLDKGVDALRQLEHLVWQNPYHEE